MIVIAEGVESFEELAYLQAATEIRFARGYYFAKLLFVDSHAGDKPHHGGGIAARQPRLERQSQTGKRRIGS